MGGRRAIAALHPSYSATWFPRTELLVTPQAADSLSRTMQSLAAATCAKTTPCQRRLSTNRNAVGRALSRHDDRWRGLLPGLLSLHRTQSAASPDGSASARVSPVQLSRPCADTIDPLLSSHELLDRIGCNPDERHEAYRGAVPKRARRRLRRRPEGGD
jgi:hypothetical protein